MTLNENKSSIFNHRIIFSPYNNHNFILKYKDYSSRSNRYDYFAGNLVLAAPLNRYDDDYYNFRYTAKFCKSKYRIAKKIRKLKTFRNTKDSKKLPKYKRKH